jgi:hypothetical protein
MPIDRRAALRSIFAASAVLAVPAAAQADTGDDADLLALSAEILRRCAEAEKFDAEQIEPHEARFEEILDDETQPFEVRFAAAWAFSDDVGRTAAIDALGEIEQATDRLFDRMMAIPATTQPGRAAKVRALLVHIMRGEWRGPSGPLDWEKAQARALLGEFAGMSAADLEAI